MEKRTDTTAEGGFHINDCWNTIGVRGDASCAELARYTHCRNCPVYATVATGLLAALSSGNDVAEWTDHVAQAKSVDARDTQAVLIFRVGVEWLALPISVVKEIADLKPVHSLPHRGGGIVLGLATVRGELLICVSLAHLLGLNQLTNSQEEIGHTTYRRLLVIRQEDIRAVCPVDEVHGVYRFRIDALKDVPQTLAKATGHYAKNLLRWTERSVALLDADLLFYALKRSLA